MFRKLTATKRRRSSRTKLVKLKLKLNALHLHLRRLKKAFPTKVDLLPEATMTRT